MSQIGRRTFLRNPSHSKIYVVMTVVIAVFIILFLVLGAPVGALIFPLIVSILFTATKDRPVLIFEERHLELKLAPLGGAILVPYMDLLSFEEADKFFILDVRDRRKPLRISKSNFDKNALADIAQGFTHCKNKG